MAAKTFNPGEPVFDQGQGGNPGEPVINPRTGDLVEVSPGAQYIDPATSIGYDADDVANAAYFRASTRIGEVWRDRSRGLQDNRVLLAGNETIDAAVGNIADQLRSSPGALAITGLRVTNYNAVARSIALAYRIRKASGEETVAAISVAG